MASGMGWITMVLWLIFIVTTEGNLQPKESIPQRQPPNVNISGEWIRHSGWTIECSWTTDINDALLSVRLFRNGMQYLVHRPQVDGLSQDITTPSNEFVMRASCVLPNIKGQTGKCRTQILPVPEAQVTTVPDWYKCEVSGERPVFKLTVKEFESYLTPSDAQITTTSTDESPKKYLNCTSEGVPAPLLVWSSPVNGDPIPHDFSSARLNPKTNQWERWSSISVPKETEVACTPQITLRTGETIYGKAAHNTASYNGVPIVLATLLIISLVVSR